MSVEVRKLRPSRSDRWNDLVRRTERANTFYLFDALELQAANTGTKLHPLVGYEDGRPLGVFPVFEARHGPLVSAFSPPPKSWSTSLGPAFVGDDEPGHRRECRGRAFVEECLDWMADAFGPNYQQFYVGGWDDVRPFQWNGYEVRPRFTYLVDLTDEDEMLMRFSSDARQNVSAVDETSYVIEEGDADAIEYIVAQVAERHREQSIPFQLDADYVVELFRRLPDGCIRPYVCTVGGGPVGGLLVLEHGGTVYRWLGGVKPGGDADLPVNDLLDWHVMREATRRGLDHYDLVGAGEPSVNEYKAKFNPELRTNYFVRGGSPGVQTLVDLYSRVHFLASELRNVRSA